MTLVGNMPRFFVDSVSGNTISIRGNDAYHIGRSLRMRLGDIITVCADRVEYRAKILSISDKEVVCDVLSAEKSENEPTVNVVLYQALPKSDKMDLIVQKAVELGVYKIVPVITARCVSRPAKSGYEKRVERYNKIALEAAKQTGRYEGKWDILAADPLTADALPLFEQSNQMLETPQIGRAHV